MGVICGGDVDGGGPPKFTVIMIKRKKTFISGWKCGNDPIE